MDEQENEQVYIQVMIAFDGLQVGDTGMVPASWFRARRQYLKPLLTRRWTDGPSGDLPAED